jgi:hypothetical protein
MTVENAAIVIAGSVLRFSAQTTQQIGEALLPRRSFLRRTFSSQERNAERLAVLKLNCDLTIAHTAVAEYNLENTDYWNRSNADVSALVREMSFQAIAQAFERADCGTLDANLFVTDKSERFVIYATTTRLTNIAEELEKELQLPSAVNIEHLLRSLGPSRISTYKELWDDDQKRIEQLKQPSIANLLAEVYLLWRGENKSPRDTDSLQFNLLLEGSLAGLNLVITKCCYEELNVA